MVEQKQPIDRLLERRGFTPERPDFAERIIMKALRHPQQQPISLWAWLVRLCMEFRLPSPAVAFSLVLCIGIITGFIAPINSNINSEESQDSVYIQEFLYAD